MLKSSKNIIVHRFFFIVENNLKDHRTCWVFFKLCISCRIVSLNTFSHGAQIDKTTRSRMICQTEEVAQSLCTGLLSTLG